jgi:hypothetical protein
MLAYWEQSTCGLQMEDFDTKVEDEEQMEDPMVNKVLIMELHMINESMSNNYRNEGFGN